MINTDRCGVESAKTYGWNLSVIKEEFGVNTKLTAIIDITRSHNWKNSVASSSRFASWKLQNYQQSWAGYRNCSTHTSRIHPIDMAHWSVTCGESSKVTSEASSVWLYRMRTCPACQDTLSFRSRGNVKLTEFQ